MAEWPSIEQYRDSVSDSFGLLRSLEGFTPHRDRHGETVFTAGNFSAVFKADITDGVPGAWGGGGEGSDAPGGSEGGNWSSIECGALRAAPGGSHGEGDSEGGTRGGNKDNGCGSHPTGSENTASTGGGGGGGKATIAMKCYTREAPGLRERYKYLKGIDPGYVVPAEYLPGELYVFDSRTEGRWVDVIVSPWIEGNTLLRELRRLCSVEDTAALAALSSAFDRMALWLLRQEFAHGDLKHDNILIDSSGNLRLVDFDGIYYPALGGTKSPTIDSPAYQHPARNENYFNKHVDDYPLALISLSLHALADDPSLLRRCNDSENIILDAALIPGGGSAAGEALCLKYGHSGGAIFALCDLLRSPTPHLEGLADLLHELAAERE